MDNKSKLSTNAHHIAVLIGICLSALLVSGIGVLAKKYEWMVVELPGHKFSLIAGICSFLAVTIIVVWMLYALNALTSAHKSDSES